jgi:Zn-dependent protease
LGHLIAGLAYGYNISDTGILLLGIIPLGAYVAHEDKKDATKAEKIQFALAGVEVNLLIAGVCLLLAMQPYQWSLTMFSVANVNVLLAGINLLPASGLDGESALSAACGIDSIGEVARKWLTNKNRRQKLFRAGLPGYACFFVFSITMISKVIIWLLIGLDVVSVFFSVF